MQNPEIAGPCRFNTESILTYARGRIPTTPLEELASAALTMEIAKLDSRVETTKIQGTTMPWGISTIPLNREFHISADPSSGFEFNGWSSSSPTAVFGDPDALETTVTLGEDATVYAHILLLATLKMATTPESYGTTTPEAGANTSVKTEVPQTIRAIPADGKIFVRWSAVGKAVFSDEFAAEATVTLYGDATITAHFADDSVQILMAVSPIDAGTTNPGIGAYQIGRNQPLAITATAATGYAFSQWTIDKNGVIDNPKSADTKVTPTGPATVTAHFVVSGAAKSEGATEGARNLR
jgi:hypothetical protein